MIESYRRFKAAMIYLAIAFILVMFLAEIRHIRPEFDDYDMPPRLIGTGCEGAQGPLWADEEDDFPRCKDIHVIPLYEGD